MENFFNYITKPINVEDVEVWLKANNIIIEKVNLFYAIFINSKCWILTKL